MNKEVILSREELYALVWSESFPGLAKRYCLSTEKLRKICIRLSIPVPRPHYWNRVRAGEAEEAMPLPTNHRGDSAVTLQPAASEEQGREVSFSAIKEPLVVAVRNTLRRKMTVTNSLRDGLVRGDSSQLDVRVAPETVDRACLFMDAFIRRLRERGHRLEIEAPETFAVVGQQKMKIVCREKLTRVTLPTERSWSRTELRPTGILAFQLAVRFREKEWQESHLSLMEKLPMILDRMDEVSREITEEEEEWARHRAVRAEEERVRKEQEQRREKEVKNVKDLLHEAGRWRQAVLPREYLNAVEGEASAKGNLTPDLQDWLAWARAKADWYDPRVEVVDEWLAEVDPETLIVRSKSSS